MHLSSLTLTNVRQFDQRTFKFQPGFNLLVGENGAGKTTILRGLLAALGGTQQTGRRPKLEDDDIRLRARHAEVKATINSSNSLIDDFYFRKNIWERGVCSQPRTERPLVLIYPSNEATCSAMKVKQARQARGTKFDEFRRDEEFLYEMEREMESERLRPGADGQRFGDSRSVKEFVGKVLSSFSRDFRDFYWRFEPYDCSLVSTESTGNELLDKDKHKQIKAAVMRHLQEERYFRRGWRYRWPDQSKILLTPESEKRAHDDRLPYVGDIWKSLEVEKLPIESLRLLRNYSLEIKLTPRITIQRKGGQLNLSQLSDGEQRLFSLFVDIARQLLLQNPTDRIGDGEAIIMIDEIDVHLHPRWQRKIIPALEDLFGGCQFIATTHSPFVIQAVASHKIQHIDGSLMGDVHNRGIEEIAVKVMGIEEPQVSARYLEMLDTAKEYFRLLEHSSNVPAEQRDELKARLRSVSRRYAENPAYQAYLEIHGQLALGPDELR